MYNNILSNIVEELGKFVFLYESEKLRNNSDIKNASLFPNIVKNFNALIKPQLASEEIIKEDIALKDQKLHMKKRIGSATVLNSFLYHLRNAFAHGQIEEKNGFYFMTDYEWEDNTSKNGGQQTSKNSKKNLSALGVLSCTNLNSFLNSVINDYENPIANVSQTNSNDDETENS